MSITTRKTPVQTGADPSDDAPQDRVLRDDVRGHQADSDGRRHVDLSGVNVFSAAGRNSLWAPLRLADRDGWRWQLMAGLGRTLLFVATFLALAVLVDAFG